MLFIDDEVPLVTLVTHALTRLGYEVIPAHDGKEAIDELQREGEALDAIVLDLVLPDTSPAELLERIRAVAPDVPIIVASGLDRSEAMRITGGAGLILGKPYTLSDLRDTLAAATGDH